MTIPLHSVREQKSLTKHYYNSLTTMFRSSVGGTRDDTLTSQKVFKKYLKLWLL